MGAVTKEYKSHEYLSLLHSNIHYYSLVSSDQSLLFDMTLEVGGTKILVTSFSSIMTFQQTHFFCSLNFILFFFFFFFLQALC